MFRFIMVGHRCFFIFLQLKIPFPFLTSLHHHIIFQTMLLESYNKRINNTTANATTRQTQI